jgi:hypothetical protein
MPEACKSLKAWRDWRCGETRIGCPTLRVFQPLANLGQQRIEATTRCNLFSTKHTIFRPAVEGWRLVSKQPHERLEIAAAAASSDLKTLVFVQSTILAEASMKDFPNLLDTPQVKLTDEELDKLHHGSPDLRSTRSASTTGKSV